MTLHGRKKGTGSDKDRSEAKVADGVRHLKVARGNDNGEQLFPPRMTRIARMVTATANGGYATDND